MRNSVVLLLSGLIYTVIAPSSASSSEFSKPKTGIIHDGSSINNANDFITALESVNLDQALTFEKLNSLTRDVKNNTNMAYAFMALLKSQQLSEIEKAIWLKTNLARLPTPFFLLLALFEPDLEEAKNIYVLLPGLSSY